MQLTFDDYLTNRIKLGKYQYYEFIILSMIEFMSGFQEIFVGILVRILKTEWKISDTQQMILGSTFYGGVMIGNSVCSALADWAGRRILLLISQACTVLTILINSFAQTYTEIVIALFLYGLLFGIAMPISQVMISEIVPVKTRGRFIVLLQLIYIFGILYLTLCCVIFLDNFDRGNWRILLRFNTIPAALCLLGSLFWLRESPRLYIARGQFEKGFSELDFMGRMNNKFYQSITSQEQNQMIEWQKITLQQQFEDVSPLGLIKFPNLRISLTIWAIFMSFNIISTGIQMITPYIYADNDSGFGAAFIAYSSEIVAILVVVALIDIPKWGGRINVTIYGLVLLAIVQISIWYWEQAFVVWGLVFQRFSIRVVWSCLNAMPAESYSTAYRSKGVGAAQGIGKLSGMISPFPMLMIYDKQNFLPFLVCAGMSLLTLFLVLIYPINATQKQLDSQTGSSAVIPDEAEDFKTMSHKSNGIF